MTKQEAITAMKDGKKVRHRYFLENEWMKMIDPSTLMFEDGVKCSFGLFWYDRPAKEWNNDWQIVNDKS